MTTQLTIKQQAKKELVQFIHDMEHVERNLALFKSLPIASVLDLELPDLDILHVLKLTFEEGRYSNEERNEFLEVAKFGAICFQLGFTFNGDGFGLPLTAICYMCSPDASIELLNSHDGFNFMDDDMPFGIDEVLMEETKGEVMSNRLRTILQEKKTQIHEQS